MSGYSRKQLEDAFETEQKIYRKLLHWITTLGFRHIGIQYRAQGQENRVRRTVEHPQLDRAHTFTIMPHELPGAISREAFTVMPRYSFTVGINTDLDVNIAIRKRHHALADGTDQDIDALWRQLRDDIEEEVNSVRERWPNP